MQYKSEELTDNKLGDTPEYTSNIAGGAQVSRIEDADITSDTLFVNKVIQKSFSDITAMNLTEIVVYHGLGYRPVVLGWHWQDGNAHRNMINQIEVAIKKIDNNNIYLDCFLMNSADKLYLKLFLLEIEAI